MRGSLTFFGRTLCFSFYPDLKSQLLNFSVFSSRKAE